MTTLIFVAVILVSAVFVMLLAKGSASAGKTGQKRIPHPEDELLYDPETGARFTLEQAEAGTWIANDNHNHNRIRPQEEIDTYFEGTARTVEEIANELKSSGFNKIKLTPEQEQYLDHSKLLSRYKDWSYDNAFRLKDGDFVFFPYVTMGVQSRHSHIFMAHQILFCPDKPQLSGHYVLREKQTVERFFDVFRKDDAFELGHFEVFTIVQGFSERAIQQFLQPLARERHIEIEIYNGRLLIKTTNDPSLEQFRRLLKLVFTEELRG